MWIPGCLRSQLLHMKNVLRFVLGRFVSAPYVRFLGQIYDMGSKRRHTIGTVASVPAATSSVFMQRFR